MPDNSFELVTKRNYFRSEGTDCRIEGVGKTVAELVNSLDVSEAVLRDIDVIISKGDAQDVVPPEMWARVKPAAGSHVLICPRVQGPAAAAIISALLPTAATAIAGSLFAAGTIAYTVAVVAITIVGSLAVNALIPPPSAPKSITEDDPNFSITGSSNAENRYGIYPTVIGRHKIFPPKTARGYTEGTGENIYYRGRFTFGYGPVALEDLRIGTTPISEFEGIELEFLNVDRDETLARIPDIGPLVKAWRTGSDKLRLYPDDIAEDAEQIRLTKDNSIVRRTRERAVSASVDVTFQGLVSFDSKNNKKSHSAKVRFRYCAAGTNNWVNVGTETYSGASSASLRFTKSIQFPTDGEYDIEVTRLTEDSDDAQIRDDAFVTAIRSTQSGSLPSHPDIAEVAIKVKASDQLNGQLDSVNAIALQMAPVWNGQSWSGFKVVRHPAWQYARALMGPMIEDPVSETRLQLGDLLAWYNEEPHWTCDMVIDQPAQVAEIVDIICAAGRARRTMRDLKYSIVRDGGAGPVIQQFTPRNSWDFRGEISFPKEIHGFLVRFVSEALDWQQDEMVVYFDGYHAGNATKFETLELRGVVLTEGQRSGGNAWKLARYHGAQAKLRPETMSWQCDFENLKVNMGDKVRLVHDVPMIGLGFGRVKTLTEADGLLQSLVLDEFISAVDGNYRVIVRRRNGEEVIFSATPPTSYDGIWTLKAGQNVAGGLVSIGDLVSIEKMEQQSFEILVKSIRHGPDFTATISGVPASPEVLQADQGAIPDYVPTITKVQPREAILPASPVIKSALPRVVLGPAQVVADVLIAEHDRFEGDTYHVSVRHPDGTLRRPGPFKNGEFEVSLSRFGVHQVSVRRENARGQMSAAASIDVDWSLDLTRPADVAPFNGDVVGNHIHLKWDASDPLVSRYDIRHLSTPEEGGWAQAMPIAATVQGGAATVPLLGGEFFIRAIGHWGQKSANVSKISISDSSVYGLNVVKTLDEAPEFSGQKSEGLYSLGGRLYLGSVSKLSSWGALSGVGRINSHGGVAPSGEYTLSEVVDLGSSYVSRLSASVVAHEHFTNFTLASWPQLSRVTSISGAVDDDYWGVSLMVQATPDDPANPAAVWSDWFEFYAGDYEGRGLRFKLVLRSDDPLVQVMVSKLVVHIDMPDRDEGASDVDCPAEGMQIMFDTPFKERPAIVVLGESLPAGAVARPTNQTKDGFHIQFVDSANQGIACKLDWLAKGYGRKT